MLEKEEKPVGVMSQLGYTVDELRFDTTPRTKRAKGIKQTMPITKITRTSLSMNFAAGMNGRKINMKINPMNNMLSWKSSPRPVT